MIDDLEALAKRNGRSINDELIHAIKRHLAQPPTVRIEEPKFDPVEIDRPAKVPGKRGRPRTTTAEQASAPEQGQGEPEPAEEKPGKKPRKRKEG